MGDQPPWGISRRGGSAATPLPGGNHSLDIGLCLNRGSRQVIHGRAQTYWPGARGDALERGRSFGNVPGSDRLGGGRKRVCACRSDPRFLAGHPCEKHIDLQNEEPQHVVHDMGIAMGDAGQMIKVDRPFRYQRRGLRVVYGFRFANDLTR